MGIPVTRYPVIRVVLLQVFPRVFTVRLYFSPHCRELSWQLVWLVVQLFTWPDEAVNTAT